MQITLITKEKIFSLRLPDKQSGKYWVEDKSLALGKQRILSVEADENLGRWRLHESNVVRIYDRDGNRARECFLEEGMLYKLELGKRHEAAFLLAEAFDKKLAVFSKYRVCRDMTLGIGRSPDNQIVIDNPYVSSHHALITFVSGNWKINAAQGTNGTYLNEQKVDGEALLKPGDLISILDFKMIIGGSFIAVNNPSDSVKINPGFLEPYAGPDATGTTEEYEEPEETYYYRSPHFTNEIEELKLKIDAPTNKERMDSTPILLSLAPSMIMGVASFSTGIFAMINASSNGGSIMSSIPTLMMSVSMMAGMIVFPFIMKKRDNKQKAKNEEERRQKYHKYLDNIRSEITRVRLEQENLLREKLPAVSALISNADFWKDSLWWKRPDQYDFLTVRLGMGDRPMRISISYPEERFSIDDDVLRNELFSFAKESHLLKDVPIGISLVRSKVFGIVGDKRGVYNLLNNVLLQILLEHSYDEVKLILLCEAGEDSRLRYLRSVGHIWDNEGKVRYLAESEDELRELTISVGKIIRSRTEGEHKESYSPRYIIVSTSKDMENKCSFLNEILENPDDIGFSVICAYDEVSNLPKECTAIAQVTAGSGSLEACGGENIEKQNFMQDQVSVEYSTNTAQLMGEYKLDLQKGKYNLPEMLTFLDMFGVRKIEHLNIMKRWTDNNPVRSLRVPVGVGVNGELFWLDLHEKIHGPHGLVAGMTGSGKSEFIITYILSLAINYHPDEVAFVLIDYKGGGLAGAFDNDKYRLPHLAGTITNLDTSAVLRSILSIKSELRRRQSVFNKARSIINEGTMDIYKYQKMYREGLVDEPMPHLFIISDEFAELKSQQPEFMEQLISTARIGRSLGVHLILATQKPAGVVNEQIWANSKFKVCLKVQDKADSMDMLKRPDAAELTETGRFWLQVGYNESFDMGQSAWAGAPYEVGEPDEDANSYVEILDELGNVTDKLKPVRESKTREDGKQIVRIMEYLDSLAKEQNIHERQMWLPKLKNILTIGEILEKYSITPADDGGLNGIVGELDDPYTQSQRPLVVDLEKGGNVIIYGAAGSGSELFEQSLLYSLTSKYSAAKLNIFVLDFGSETLRMFAKAPQISGIMHDGEDDAIETFFSFISKEMGKRKKLLSDFGGELKNYNESVEEPLPSILIILENYSHFVESYERYEDNLMVLTRECVKFGIYVLMSAASDSSVRYKIKQNFTQAFAFRLNDKLDYSSIFGSVGGVYPDNINGQGIFKADEVYVFQTAHPVTGDSTETEAVKAYCENLRNNAEHVAAQMKMVPAFISGKEASAEIEGDKIIPVGFSFENCDFVRHDFNNNCILSVFADDLNDSAELAAGMLEAIAGKNMSIIAINVPENLKRLTQVSEELFEGENVEKIEKVYEIAIGRNHYYKKPDEYPAVDMSPMYVFLFGLRELMANDTKENYIRMVLDAMRPEYNMFFVVTDASRSVGYYSSNQWYSKSTWNGVWVGSGVTRQNCFSVRGISNETAPTPFGTGYYISRDKADRIKLVLPEGLREEKEDEK